MKERLCLAAPLFSEAEKQYNHYLKGLLSLFFDVYLPQEDGKLLVNLVAEGMNIKQAENLVFTNDVQAISSSDVLLILLDGRAVDEGATFELGYAYALGKLCIALQTDPRRLLPTGNNPMLKCSLSNTFSSTKELLEWCHKRNGNSTTVFYISNPTSNSSQHGQIAKDDVIYAILCESKYKT